MIELKAFILWIVGTSTLCIGAGLQWGGPAAAMACGACILIDLWLFEWRTRK